MGLMENRDQLFRHAVTRHAALLRADGEANKESLSPRSILSCGEGGFFIQ